MRMGLDESRFTDGLVFIGGPEHGKRHFVRKDVHDLVFPSPDARWAIPSEEKSVFEPFVKKVHYMQVTYSLGSTLHIPIMVPSKQSALITTELFGRYLLDLLYPKKEG